MAVLGIDDGRRSILKKIVIMKGSFIDSLEEYALREILRIMFPECAIEIQSDPSLNSSENFLNDRQIGL